MKQDLLKVSGIVIQALTNTQFMVQFTDKSNTDIVLPATMRCILAGRVNRNRIQIKVGDRVQVEIPSKEFGRIYYRG